MVLMWLYGIHWFHLQPLKLPLYVMKLFKREFRSKDLRGTRRSQLQLIEATTISAATMHGTAHGKALTQTVVPDNTDHYQKQTTDSCTTATKEPPPKASSREPMKELQVS